MEKHAKIYVLFLSKGEGFGLPVLEAVLSGKTALCSRLSAVPEVAGSIVYYVDAYDIASIRDGMLYLNDDSTILITSFFGLYIAGKYANYCAVYEVVIGFFLVTTRAVQASIGNSIVSETVEKNYENLTRMEFLHNIVITACTVYMLTLYQPFMKMWMGEALMFPDPVMMLFVLYFHIRAMGEVRNAYFSALGYWWKAKWIFVAEAVAVILLMICLGKLFGAGGIIIAPSISVLTVNYIGITNLIFREYFKTGPGEYYCNRIVYTVITVLVSAVSWMVCDLVPYEGVAGIAVRLVSCTLVVAIMIPSLMYLLKREYMKESVSFVRQIITVKR